MHYSARVTNTEVLTQAFSRREANILGWHEPTADLDECPYSIRGKHSKFVSEK